MTRAAPNAPADAPPPAPDAPDAPDAAAPDAAAPDALAADIPDLAAVARPAPGADPVGAHAFFVGPDGVEAWLDTSGDQPVGYMRDVARPYRVVRIDDARAWAQIVDDLGLHEDPVPTVPTPAPAQPSEQDAPDAAAAPTAIDAAASDDTTGDPTLAGEGKSVRGKFDAAKHPRDKHGRFMHIGDRVDLGGGSHGKITGTTSDGKLTVRKASGGTVKVDPKSVAKVGPGKLPPARPEPPRAKLPPARPEPPRAKLPPARPEPPRAKLPPARPEEPRAQLPPARPEEPRAQLPPARPEEPRAQLPPARPEEPRAQLPPARPEPAQARSAVAAVDAVYAGGSDGGSTSGGPHANLSDDELSKAMQSAPPGPEFDALYAEATHRADSYASTLLGSLGKIEPGVTSTLTGMADKYGGQMEGLDFRLKAQDSLTRKIRDKSLVSGKPMTAVSAKIGDALRYTMILDESRYSEGASAVLRDFEAQGMTIVDQDNSWHPGNIYQGVNSVIRTPDGFMFELQFHTQSSFDAKNATHHDYELSRDPTAPLADRLAAWDRMAKLQSKTPVPTNVGSVGVQRVYAPPTAPSPAPAAAAAIKSIYVTMEAERKEGGVTMATRQPSGGGARRFYALHLLGDSEPFAIAAKSATGAPERWVPGQGWVDMPVLADYFTGEDPGAREITPEQAHTYMESGLGAMGEGAVEKLRGAK